MKNTLFILLMCGWATTASAQSSFKENLVQENSRWQQANIDGGRVKVHDAFIEMKVEKGDNLWHIIRMLLLYSDYVNDVPGLDFDAQMAQINRRVNIFVGVLVKSTEDRTPGIQANPDHVQAGQTVFLAKNDILAVEPNFTYPLTNTSGQTPLSVKNDGGNNDADEEKVAGRESADASSKTGELGLENEKNADLKSISENTEQKSTGENTEFKNTAENSENKGDGTEVESKTDASATLSEEEAMFAKKRAEREAFEKRQREMAGNAPNPDKVEKEKPDAVAKEAGLQGDTDKPFKFKGIYVQVMKVKSEEAEGKMGGLLAYDKQSDASSFAKGKIAGKKVKSKGDYYKVKTPSGFYYFEMGHKDLRLTATGIEGRLYFKKNVLLKGTFLSEYEFIPEGLKEAMNVHDAMATVSKNFPLHFEDIDVSPGLLSEMLFKKDGTVAMLNGVLYSNKARAETITPASESLLFDFNEYKKQALLKIADLGDSRVALLIGKEKFYSDAFVFNQASYTPITRVSTTAAKKEGSLMIDGYRFALSAGLRKNIEQIRIIDIGQNLVEISFKNGGPQKGTLANNAGKLAFKLPDGSFKNLESWAK